ncbi:pyridoxal phosphate-dependent aminotransferase [Tunicatimonas pelagia]|uniref:pyridoxal phosphate-dependent aminotransferase n=1 Tax=Tunicatimonas pelagia TaxID=931531 RepID=UPI00266635AF|nr:pyridoxal phosphate-dependent aminotransferase [Tunicatimonas pelagia]WKN45286.1 pyridoxal phosphate-dependent aminotransferase [Tunicatimonas pelagia]
MEQAVAQPLSERIQKLAESATIAMAQKAREYKAKGINVISLSLGEPDFKTPQHIQEAAKAAIDEGKYFGYSPVPGYLDLRQAIADKLQRDNNLTYSPNQIVVSTGAKQSIANVFMCLLNPGDEVIVYAPYWVSYAEIIKVAEGVPVPIVGTLENNFKATTEQLKEAITSRTKAVIFSSPSNPTGSVFTREEMEAMADVLRQHPNIYVVADEIYEFINFQNEHVSIAALPGMYDNTVTINGFSKGYAMTGWRLGYIAAPEWIAKACGKIQGQFTSGPNSITQRAAIAALTGDMSSTQEMKAAYQRRRDLVLELLQDVPGVETYVPTGAFYLFPDISAYFGKSDGETTIENASDLCMYILNKAHVSLVTGEAFGAPNCIRMSFAASDEQLKEAIGRIKEALSQLN